MPDRHAKLSCSASARWINCPGSVRLSEGFPSGSSVYAEEGTIAHKYLEEMIKDDAKGKQAALDQAEKFYQSHPGMDDTADSVKHYIGDMFDWVLTEYGKEQKTDPSAQIYSEQRVDLSGYIPGGFGTTDVTIARTGFIHIIDLKYGKGVPVYAEDNSQLRLYALGMLEMLDMIYDIKRIRMTIYQPRLENISTDEIDAADLRAWGDEVVIPAAELALSNDAPFSAGTWCQFCPAKASCRARAKYNLELEDYRQRTTLSDAEIGKILGRIDELTKWADDIRTGALEEIQQGGDIPGWKVVAGRSTRRFKGDEKDIVAAAEKAGYDKPLLYETRMITLSAMEKLMGKKTFAQALSAYVEKPQGKPTLAPVSDKRPSIIGGNPADVFAGEEDIPNC